MSYVYERRLKKVSEEAAKKEAEAAVITSSTNIFYLTGYEGGGALIVPVDKDPVLLVSRLEYNRAKDTSYVDDIRVFAYPNTPLKVDEKPVYAENFNEALSKLLKELEVKKAAIEAPSEKLKEILKKNNGVEVVDFTEVVPSMRALKDEVEMELIVKAIRVTERAMKKAIEKIDIGVSEREIAAEIVRAIYLEGELAFPPIVASGENSVYPHFSPSDRKLHEGDLVVIDVGARVNGYCADMTRTVFVGKPRGKIKEMLDAVLEAQIKAIESIVDGKPASEVDDVARKQLSKRGFVKFFVHGLGHGVGLNVHEKPTLNPVSKDTLKEKMVVTVEPGVYIPGLGGVRTEDMVLVTSKGSKVLTRFEREIF